MNTRMNTRPFVVRTQLECARALLARGQRGDRQRARALLAEAAAEDMGMIRLSPAILKLQGQIDPAAPARGLSRS